MSITASSNVQSIWYTRCPVPTPLGIAAHLGWLDSEFAGDGITVRALQESQHAALHHAHVDHSLDNAFRQGGSIPALWARAAGADTRVVALTWVDEAQAIVALPESGLKRPKDLRGRRIGLPRRDGERIDIFRAAALRGFVSALSLDGLGPADVEWVDVPASNLRAPVSTPATRDAAFSHPASLSSRRLYAAEAAALVRGEVDAVFVKGVEGLETVHLIDAQVVIDLGAHPDPLVRIGNGTPRTLTVDRALIDARPDLVSRFLSVVVGAGDWAARHPAETVAYIGRETRASDEWVRYAYGADVHRHLETGLAQTSIDGLVAFKDFLVEWGFLEQDFDARAWIDPAPFTRIDRQRHAWVA